MTTEPMSRYLEMVGISLKKKEIRYIEPSKARDVASLLSDFITQCKEQDMDVTYTLDANDTGVEFKLMGRV